MSKKTVLLVGSSTSYLSWLLEHKEEWERTYSIDRKPDLVFFTGGTDINPMLYGQKPIFKTQHPDNRRDVEEVNMIHECIKQKIPMMGVCRGAQLLCAMNGGKLIQDVNNHGSNHEIDLYDNQKIIVTSSHHQMMDPTDLTENEDYLLLGWSNGLSDHYETDKTKIIKTKNPVKEPEILYFPDTKSFCIQSHPEYNNMPAKSRDIVYEMFMGFVYGNHLEIYKKENESIVPTT